MIHAISSAFDLLSFAHWSNRRVHISEATLTALDNAFQVEDGRGFERDEYLREKKTYLIVEKVGHPCGRGLWEGLVGVACGHPCGRGLWEWHVGILVGVACEYPSGSGMWASFWEGLVGFLVEGHVGILVGGACCSQHHFAVIYHKCIV